MSCINAGSTYLHLEGHWVAFDDLLIASSICEPETRDK